MTEPCKIAVTGMACIFPGAGDLSAYHNNLDAGVDAIQEVPEHRWDTLYYDPDSDSSDRFYCKRGGFIDDYATFDPFSFGIMPVAAEGAEPDQLLSLKVSYQALADAGYDDSTIPCSRTGIILGRGNYIGSGMVRLEQHVRTAQQLVTSLETLVPGISEDQLEQVRREFKKKLGNYGPDTAIGLVPNLTASRVANRLNLCGPAYTIDAACASSLMAIDQAVKSLQLGQCDLMLAGGVHLCHDVSFWSVFTQLGILSKSQMIRPFDQRADGVLIGEGIGVVVLKRYDDAVADGDRIYAVVNGVGVSSDGKASSLMFPDVGGQTMALERAWEMSGLNPDHIGYIEAHGTGAPAGDTSELTTLTGFFKKSGDDTNPGLGSVKSMIGHCMPAAGIAGFIKTALSIYHKKRFPSLHCSQPNESVDKTGFRLIQRSEEWHTDGIRRIAGVNAFGFGGINVHVVMSEDDRKEQVVSAAKHPNCPGGEYEDVLIISAGTLQEMEAALSKGKTHLAGGKFRLVVFRPDDKKLLKAQKIIQRGLAWRGRGDIYYSPDGLYTNGGKIAFLFPGVDSSFDPKLEDVAAWFSKPVPDFLNPGGLEETGVGIIRVNQFMHSLLVDLGITPHVMAGHSIGEWSGMIASGIVDPDSLDEFIKKLEPGSLDVPDVAFAAAGCAVDTADTFIADLENICVSNDNCGHQVILCGIDASIDAALDAMKKKGILCQKLPFRSGFHSPLYAESLSVHHKNLDHVVFGEMKTPLWSATTCTPYPEDESELKHLIIDHLVKPVRFRETILKLHGEGVRIFIQSGTGSLSGFVQDILKEKEFSAINTNTAKMTGMQQLRRALAACFIEGMDPDLKSAGMVEEGGVVASGTGTREMPLTLGVPLVRFDSPLKLAGAGSSFSGLKKSVSSHPVLETYNTTLSEIAEMQEEILQNWQSPSARTKSGHAARAVEKMPVAVTREFTLELSLDRFPWLIDHSLFPQYQTCTSVYEKYPVVPMTMSIDILAEYALKMVPGKKVTAIENVQAFNWIDVCQPLNAEIEAEYDGTGKVTITIKGYLKGTVILSDAYPQPPEPAPFVLENQTDAPVTAENLYKKGWMFHGPAYQGVKELGPLGDNGIRGMITACEGRGSLLDNAGQLFGYWVMAAMDKDKLAMPIRLGKIEFFSDQPGVGKGVNCVVKAHPVMEKSASADIELTVGNTVWAIITGWEDRRFDTDDALFDVMKDAGVNMLSSVDDHGYLRYRDVYKTANATNYISRRYCTEAEKQVYDRILPKQKRAWLNTLIAAKDAVRNQLFATGAGPVYPGEITITGDQLSGRCEAKGPSGEMYQLVAVNEESYSAAMVTSNGDDCIDMGKQLNPADMGKASAG